jgi:hypothetical protein
VVIVPPDAWHTFVNTCPDVLRQAAIHQNPPAFSDLRTAHAVNSSWEAERGSKLIGMQRARRARADGRFSGEIREGHDV